MIETSLFPYKNFPYRLEFGEKQGLVICFFECEEHLEKYLTRHKLDKRKVKIQNRNEEPIVSSPTNKRKVRQATGKNNHGSSGTVSKRTSRLDSTKNTTRSTKRKK